MASLQVAPSLETLQRTVSEFLENTNKNPFRLLYSSPGIPFDPASTSTLHVLDASFNPPHLAHLHLALSLLPSTPTRLLLLLTTSNPDKRPSPLPFHHRLHLLRHLIPKIHKHPSNPIVDVAICLAPRFVDKEGVLRGAYPGVKKLVFGVGWDTVIRIVDGKYYSEDEGGLEVVRNFLRPDGCELRVLGRGMAGREEEVGLMMEWGNVSMVTGAGVEAVSSTRIREIAGSEEGEAVKLRELEKLTVKGIAEEILREGLYRDDSS